MTLAKGCEGCDLEDFCKLLYLDVEVGESVYCPDGTEKEVEK
jgi:hypothetical protein